MKINVKVNISNYLMHIGFAIIGNMLAFQLNAQSGGWDASGTNGTSGYTDHGNGVIQLLNTTNTGCAAAAIHETSDKYDPSLGIPFNKCYQVYFGCPDDDEIGGPDQKGDGLAFSFSKCGYNINNGLACGGGLGYMGSCGQMITIEFDTWSSQGNTGFDATFGGGNLGINDEIAIHRDGIASDAGKITSVNAGNLEDGLEHTVCISYTPTSRILDVTLDGNLMISYDLGLTYNLQNYFGPGGLNQTWSSGKFNATNPATVSNGFDISDQIGGPLCPANVVLTSPASSTVISSCSGPIMLSAASTPPAGNTISQIEFFVDGITVGTDVSEPYFIPWNNMPIGNHQIHAVATFIPSNTIASSSTVPISVGGGMELTSSAPVIDGVMEAFWNNYTAFPLNEVPWGVVTGGADVAANYRTMRDATNLYILVSVTDNDLVNDGGPNPWENDGIEIFIDKGNDKNATYGANDFQYAFVYNSAVITEYKHAPGSLVGVNFSQGTIAGGYIMEIQIPWSTVGGAPVDGEFIGFDVHVNDDDAGGPRDGKIAWNDAMDIAFNNPQGFGTIEVSDCNPCPFGILSGTNFLCDSITSTTPLQVDFTGASPWTFTYEVDGTNQITVVSIGSSPYVFPSQTGEHNYSLISVSNPFTNGCSNNASGVATVTVSTNIPIPIDSSFTPPGSTMLSVLNQGGTYQWFDAPVNGNMVNSGISYVTPILNDTTYYYVQEVNGAPCRARIVAFPIPMIDLGEFFIPNLITENNDGKNDRFEITALPSGSSLSIFNRWGDQVYLSSDYDNLWDGENASDGIYFYDLKLPDGKNFKGWLQIIKQ